GRCVINHVCANDDHTTFVSTHHSSSWFGYSLRRTAVRLCITKHNVNSHMQPTTNIVDNAKLRNMTRIHRDAMHCVSTIIALTMAFSPMQKFRLNYATSVVW